MSPDPEFTNKLAVVELPAAKLCCGMAQEGADRAIIDDHH